MFTTMTRHHHLALGGVEVACDGRVSARQHCGIRRITGKNAPGQLAMKPTFIRVFVSVPCADVLCRN